MQKVLFICLNYFENGPRAIRTRAIVRALSSYYDIHVLCLATQQAEQYHQDRYALHTIPVSLFGRIIRFKTFPSVATKNQNEITHAKQLLKRIALKLSLKKLFVPDVFVTEKRSLVKHIRLLLTDHQFHAVIGSAFPFTVMGLGKTVKKYSPSTLWIIDLGDPYYKNSALSHGVIMEIIAQRFERAALAYADALIVTNEKTKDAYVASFGDRITSKKIYVIKQGTEVSNQQEANSRRGLESTQFRLLYAGTIIKGLREPDQLFEAVGKLNGGVRLDIYGQNPIKYNFKKYSADLGTIIHHGMIGHDSISAAYQNSDLLVFIDNAHGFQYSGKIFELLATTKPILFIYTISDSDAMRIAKDYEGVTYCHNVASDIKRAINEIRIGNTPLEYKRDLSQHSWERRAKGFLEILQKECL
jgi:glycosyltransferase involved in cell wall biosynthesis